MVSWNKFQWDLLSARWRAQCNAYNLFRLSFSWARTQKIEMSPLCACIYIRMYTSSCFRRLQNLVGHFKQSNPPLFELCACPWVWTRSCNYWLWYYPRGWNDLVSWDLSNYTYLLHNSLKTSINLFFAFPKHCTTWHCSHLAFPSILLTYFHIFSTGFLFFLKYSLFWCIHDCSLSLNIYTTYHCKCEISAVLKKSTTKCTNATLLSIHPPFSHQVLGNPPQILFLSGPGDSLKLSPEFLLTGCWNLTELV